MSQVGPSAAYLLGFALSASSAIADTETYPLRSGIEIPADLGQVPFVKGMDHPTILDAREHDYKFLRGASLIIFKGSWHANWANSPQDENLAWEGLRPSIRIVSHREGMMDHALLTLVEQQDPALAQKLVSSIASSIVQFEHDPAAYYRARKTLLEALDPS